MSFRSRQRARSRSRDGCVPLVAQRQSLRGGDGRPTFHIEEIEPRADARLFRVEVDSDCGYCRGHFPERPILPAVGQLQLVVDIARRAGYLVAAQHCLEALKLHSPIGPGEVVELELKHDSVRSSLRFRILRNGLVAAEGRFETGAGDRD